MYFVYILKCSDNSLYTWITTDLERRKKEHNWDLPWWAKYTKWRWPVEIVYSEEVWDRSLATKREKEIKKLTKNKKKELIKSFKK